MEMLLPILLADVLNPVLLAYLIYAAGSPRGALTSFAALSGHTVAYFCAGLILLAGFDRLGGLLANPGAIDYAVSLAVGLLLLWVACRLARPGPAGSGREPEEPVGPAAAFLTGAVVNFIGLPFALPYFAAVDQIIKADLELAGSLGVLAAYNAAYALPFLVVPVLTAAMGEGSRRVLQRINEWVARGSAVLMPVMLLLLGAFLVLDGLSYFVRGEGLV